MSVKYTAVQMANPRDIDAEKKWYLRDMTADISNAVPIQGLVSASKQKPPHRRYLRLLLQSLRDR